jgi:hypothetical protein
MTRRRPLRDRSELHAAKVSCTMQVCSERVSLAAARNAAPAQNLAAPLVDFLATVTPQRRPR